ncbi:MAG: long-chain fatty acid--CoA ligase [Planctomycetales bacterium]|nr:long-chain fatty acid--CoA ligase [Planctomycetales bacterium]
MSINDWLGRRRTMTPDRIAIVEDESGRRYSYAELDARASDVAEHLQRTLGVQPGDRVACVATNRVEYVDLYFACGKIGAILVPLNYRLSVASLLELIGDSQPSVLVYESEFAGVADAAMRAGVASQYWDMDAPEHCIVFDAQLAAGDGNPSSANVYPAVESDAAMILYTSGTTGRPKGAVITYRQIHWNALNTILGLQLTQDDTAFLNLPLYHTGGWHVLTTPLLMLGGRLVLQKRFDAERCNDRLGPETITILFGVPTTLRMMYEAPNFAAADFASVRFAIFGGESCPLPVIEAYGRRGVAMRQGYGLTEAGPNCFSLPSDDALRKPGSIGLPNFFVEARLRKDDATAAVVGEVGELQLRGPHVCDGYWQAPQESAALFQDGWLRTGDLMTCDGEGYYYVVGRKKDMYVSGGENVYPAQIERVLQRHDAVALAGVVGVPDARWGEVGIAFVQLQPGHTATESDLHAWCRTHLAKFQCPVRIVIAGQLPLGDSGKIDKKALAQRAVAVTDT